MRCFEVGAGSPEVDIDVLARLQDGSPTAVRLLVSPHHDLDLVRCRGASVSMPKGSAFVVGIGDLPSNVTLLQFNGVPLSRALVGMTRQFSRLLVGAVPLNEARQAQERRHSDANPSGDLLAVYR